MILSKRADIDRFLASPPPEVRAAVIHGRDRAIVRERADAIGRKIVKDLNDPFDVAMVTEGDIDGEPARLYDELAALSLMGGRRLVRLRLDDKASADRTAAEALKAHLAGELNPDAFFLVEAGALGRDSGLRKAAALLPQEPWDVETWRSWTDAVKQSTGKKGKDLFMPLRLALTGVEHGPELKVLLPLIGRDRALRRLRGETA